MFNNQTFALSRIKIKSLDLTINKNKKFLHILYSQKKLYFYQEITKNTAFWHTIHNSQQVYRWIKKYRNDKFRSNQKRKQTLFTKILKIQIFDLKYTDHNKYGVELREILIRKLLSMRIERNECVKASKHAKNMFFDPKMQFFTQNSERSTCKHLHHLDLDSGGQSYLEMTKKNSLHTLKPRVCEILLDYLYQLSTKWNAIPYRAFIPGCRIPHTADINDSYEILISS